MKLAGSAAICTFRLKIVSVHLEPSLQATGRHIAAGRFLPQVRKQEEWQIDQKSFSQDLRRWLLDYDWKGNVRQLKNVVESLVVMDIDNLLDIDDLSPDLLDELQPQKNWTSTTTPAVAPLRIHRLT